MIKKLLFPILCVCILGCKQEVPKEFIQPDRMVNILFDTHIADGYISTIVNQDSAKKVGAAFYKGIYIKFNTDSIQYNKSLDFYYKNPKIFTPIYDKVLDRLNKSKSQIDKRNQ